MFRIHTRVCRSINGSILKQQEIRKKSLQVNLWSNPWAAGDPRQESARQSMDQSLSSRRSATRVRRSIYGASLWAGDPQRDRLDNEVTLFHQTSHRDMAMHARQLGPRMWIFVEVSIWEKKWGTMSVNEILTHKKTKKKTWQLSNFVPSNKSRRYGDACETVRT